MIRVRKGKDRGHADHGWLKSYHSFSFGDYYDPANRNYSDLRVINEDFIAPGTGFGTHPHKDMEIFTYILSGSLEHKDSMGTGSTIHPGDIQMMSAGTGVEHSEFNPSAREEVHLLQIWIRPGSMGVKPRYQQVSFDLGARTDSLTLIISPNAENGSLSVYQDVKVYAGQFSGKSVFKKPLELERSYYLHVAKGSIAVNGNVLEGGDAVELDKESELVLANANQAELLLFDLRKTS